MKLKFKFKKKNELPLESEHTSRINYSSSRDRYIKKNRKELIVFSSIIVTILGGLIFINTSFFNIKTINLKGNVQIDKAQIENNIDFNTKIWQLDTNELQTNIKNSNILIKDIKITKDYFNTLDIEVVEKKIVALEKNAEGAYLKLLENGENYSNDFLVQESVPILENFQENEELKKEVLRNLTEVDHSVLNRISEIILDENGTSILIYMKDTQKIKANPKNFSSKMNYYLKIEKMIEDKSVNILNIVNGVYLETEASNRIKEDRIKKVLQESNHSDNKEENKKEDKKEVNS